jgi:DNA polymerase-3 subunit alpha
LAGNLEKAVAFAEKERENAESGQTGLFDDSVEEKQKISYHMMPFPEPEAMAKLETEKDLLGFYASGHPMDDYKEAWEKFSTLNLAHLELFPDGKHTVIGRITTIKQIVTKTGSKMAFVTIGDYRGELEMVFFGKRLPENNKYPQKSERLSAWEECEDKIEVDKIYAFAGKLDRTRGKDSFIVDKMLDIDELVKKAAKTKITDTEELPVHKKEKKLEEKDVHIRLLPNVVEENLYSLRGYLERGGPCPVYLHVPCETGEKIIAAGGNMGASPSPEKVALLESCQIVDKVWAD